MNETIPLGWQVDVNLFHRLSVLYGAEARFRSERLFGYHCTHSPLLTLPRATDAPGYDDVRAKEITRVDVHKRRKR